MLESFEGQERVSTPFRFLLKVLSYDPNIDMKGLLQQAGCLDHGLTEGGERHIHGNINRMKLLEFGDDGYAAYRDGSRALAVVPEPVFRLPHFPKSNVPDIVRRFSRTGALSDFKLQIQGSYPPREYCVQYRETDFNFVSRLMEEEGIFYFFEQTADKHTLVLADRPSAFQTCPTNRKARFLPSQGGVLEKDIVHSLESEFRVETGAASLTDYNSKIPTSACSPPCRGNAKGEAYDYPGKYKTKDEGDRYARVRLEEKEVGLATIRGGSNCLGFECGSTSLRSTDHYRDEAESGIRADRAGAPGTEQQLSRRQYGPLRIQQSSGSDSGFGTIPAAAAGAEARDSGDADGGGGRQIGRGDLAR